MKFAQVDHEMVVNVIVGREDQQEEFAQMTGCEMVPADLLRLQIGDLRVDGNWTRNIDGEQVALTAEPTRAELVQQIAALARETEQTDAALTQMGVQVYE